MKPLHFAMIFMLWMILFFATFGILTAPLFHEIRQITKSPTDISHVFVTTILAFFATMLTMIFSWIDNIRKSIDEKKDNSVAP